MASGPASLARRALSHSYLYLLRGPRPLHALSSASEREFPHVGFCVYPLVFHLNHAELPLSCIMGR
jgi:hypothetical protein